MGFGLTNRLIRIAANVGNAGFVPSNKRWKVSKRWYSENGDICIMRSGTIPLLLQIYFIHGNTILKSREKRSCR